MFLSYFLSNFTLSRGNAFIWDSKIKNLKIITHFKFIDIDKNVVEIKSHEPMNWDLVRVA